MPASVYEPISTVLKNSFYGPKSSPGLSSKMDSSLQKNMLVPVQFDDPVRQSANLSEKQKSKYVILTTVTSVGDSAPSPDSKAQGQAAKLDQVPEPRMTLFRRDQVELGYRGPAGPGSGMFNMGNTCYLNSTLQALFHTPALVNYLRYGGHDAVCSSNGYSSCTICIMSATLRGTQSQSPMKPIKIYEKLKVICKHLVHGRQEDAHEFLRYLIESLQKSYLISKKISLKIDNYSKETTPFNQIFGGYMRQDVTCLRCKYVSTTFQHFMDVLLDIRSADNIDAALAGYFRRENLGQGENMYKCEKCHQKVPATKQYKIERPPQVLCIQLKRFNMMGGKNGRPVTLARKLNISNHVRWANQKQIPVEYKLVSMINHVGPSPNCGHYTSIAEGANGTFYRFDDASVSPTSLQNALNTSAYVIFYEMLKSTRNQILSPGNGVSKSKSDPSPAKVPERKVIGPQLPSPSPTIAKIPPSPRTIPSNPGKPSQSPLVKPKLITESSPVLKKPTPAPPKIGGLVPYDGDSDSDDEVKSKQPPSPLPALKPSHTEPKPAVVTSNPFLPRAVNLKKLKDTIQKEDKPSFSIGTNGSNNPPKVASVSFTKKLEPNRDPSSEILFAKDKDVTKEDVRTVISQSRNEFHVRDIDSHSPSVHSDNSAGSTTSFTISDIAPGTRPTSASSDSYLTTSRQKWNVVSQMAASVKPGQPSKRERSSPPQGAMSKEDKEDTCSEADVQGSPKKRKKTSLLENGGHTLLSKAAELGKDILNAGAKLIKASKIGKEPGDETSSVLESGTACEASTSHSHDKASSSKITTESEERRHKKKKKKNKYKEEREDADAWEEKTKDNLDKFTSDQSVNPQKEMDESSSVKKSSFNPEAPVKSWDSKPELKTIGRSVTWDGTKSGGDIGELLRRQTEIRSWSGDRSRDLERKSLEPRKRSAAQDHDAELDAGRVKKVKKWRDETENSKWSDINPFQAAQEHRNKGHSLDRPDIQRRHSGHFSRSEPRRHSDHGRGGGGYNNRHQRFSEGGAHRDFRGQGNGHRDQRPHHHKEHRHNSFDRYKGSHHYRK